MMIRDTLRERDKKSQNRVLIDIIASTLQKKVCNLFTQSPFLLFYPVYIFFNGKQFTLAVIGVKMKRKFGNIANIFILI